MKNITTILFQTVLAMMLVIGLSTSHAASKSDQYKEKRWESQIVDSLLVGEAIKLREHGNEFLGLYAKANSDNAKGAVILLHGQGAHPAWPDVIEPLRMELPEHGWHTLSLQMPILGNDAKETEYSPLFAEVPDRIQAGVEFLKSKGINNIVVAGHSLGATMGSYYLSMSPDQAVKTFVILSGGSRLDGDEKMDSLMNFKRIRNVHIIDVYGGEDNEGVYKQLISRTAISQDLHKNYYHNLKIKGANHFYRGKQVELIEALDKQLASITTL